MLCLSLLFIVSPVAFAFVGLKDFIALPFIGSVVSFAAGKHPLESVGEHQ
jgi:hypothetical protein